MNNVTTLSRGPTILAKAFLTLIFTQLFFLWLFGVANAQVPNFINYQSRILDSGDNAITSSTTIQFSLYNDTTDGGPASSTSSTGPLLWKETYDQSSGACAQIIPDSDGYFNVQLGTCTNFPDYLDFNSAGLYLGVRVATDTEALPRAELGSTPFAQTAGKVIGTEQSAFGTTTPNPDAVVTVAATSTGSIAAIFQAIAGQIADIFQVLSSAGEELLTLTANGLFGIGSSTPSARLSVGGDAVIDGELTVTGTTTLATDLTVVNATSTNFSVTTFGINAEYFTDLTGTGLTITNGALSVATSSFDLDPGVINLAEGNVLVGNASGNAAATSTLVISSDGNVGIGSSTPGTRLSVGGDAFVDGLLTVTGTSTFSGGLLPSVDNIYSLGSPSQRWAELYVGPGTIHLGDSVEFGSVGYSTSSNYLLFDPDGDTTHDVVFTALGMVGIGTTTPSEKLTVAGDTYIGGPITVTGSSTLQELTATGATTTSLYATTLGINSEYFTDLTGSGLVNTGGVLNVDGDTFLSLADWYATTTSALAEGTNLYYTQARFNAALLGTSSLPHLVVGTSTVALTANALSGFDQNDYFTLAGWYGTTTDGLAEGSTNLYWTDARFDTRLSATTTLSNLNTLSGLTAIGASGATTTIAGNLTVNEGITLATSTPTNTDDLLYNQDSTLYWNGYDVLAGSAGGRLAFEQSIEAVGSTTTLPYQSSVTGVTVSTEGDYMYHGGNGGDIIAQYRLTTPFDITTASYLRQQPTFGFGINGPYDVSFTASGTRMFIMDQIGRDMHQFDLSTAWDVTTHSNQASTSLSESSGVSGIFFRADGQKLYVVDGGSDEVDEYNLSTDWDITSLSYQQTLSISAQTTQPADVTFRSDGYYMYVSDRTGRDMLEYLLSTPWDVSTASYVGAIDLSDTVSDFRGLYMTADGSRIYTSDLTQEAIHQFSFGFASEARAFALNSSFYAHATSTFGSGLYLGDAPQGTTTNALYNQAGSLYWNGTAVQAALSGTEGQTLVFNSLGEATATSSLFVASDGSVGIGTTTPSESLHVVGGILQGAEAAPVLEGSLIDNTNMDLAQDVYVFGDYAYVVSYTSDSLAIIDISNPASPTLEGTLIDSTNLNGAQGVYVSGNYAYVVSYDNNSLSIIDISDSTDPILISTLVDSTNLNNPFQVRVKGKYAYVGGWTGDSLAIVDISDSKNPVLTGSLIDSTNMNRLLGFEVAGNYVYGVGYFSNSFVIIDVSDPSNPTLASSLIDATNLLGATGVYVSGKYAYVASDNGKSLSVVDISDPNSPAIEGNLTDATNLDGAYSVQVSGDYAYVAVSNISSLAVVDVSSKSAPRFVSRLADSTNLNGAVSVKLSGKYAYVVGGSSDALAVVDIHGSELASADIGNIKTNTLSVSDDAVIGNSLYVRTGLNVGPGGILSQGALTLGGYISTTTSGTATTTYDAALYIASSTPATTTNALYQQNGTLYWDGEEVGDNLTGTVGQTLVFNTLGEAVATSSLFVATSTYIGIGTTTPTNELTVEGSVNITDSLTVGTSSIYIDTDSIDNLSGILTIQSNNGTTSIGGALTVDGQITLGDGGDTVAINSSSWDISSTGVITGATLDPSQITLAQGNVLVGDASNNAVATSSLFITSNGNVGIGTTTPASTLSVVGDSSFEGSFTQVIGTNSLTEVGTLTDNSTRALGAPYNLDVSGSYAYVTSNSDHGLSIVDISDPTAPVEVGSTTDSEYGGNATTLEFAWDVHVRGQYAYVTSQVDDGLSIIDISDPTNPVEVGSITDNNVGGEATALDGALFMDVAGRYIYVVSSENALSVIDVSDPRNPFEVGVIRDNGSGGTATRLDSPTGLMVSGNYAYVPTSISGGLSIIDVSDPTNMSEVGVVGVDLDIKQGVYVLDNYAYVGGITNDELIIFDVGDPTNPTEVGSISDDSEGGTATTLHNPRQIFVTGDYAFVSSQNDDGISVLDISSSTNPVEVMAILDGVDATTLQNPEDMIVVGNYLYVASNADDGLSIIDLGGISALSAQIGSLEADTITTLDNLRVGDSLFVTNGLNTGGSALFNGALTLSGLTPSSTATANIFDAALYIASSTPATTTNALYQQSGTLYWNGSEVGNNLSGTQGQTLVFDGSGNAVATSSLFIATNGNVGIGTTSPSHTLTVDGGIYSRDGLAFGDGSTQGLAATPDAYSWDISTLIDPSHDYTASEVGAFDDPEDIFLSTGGHRMYLISDDTDEIETYSLDTPWYIQGGGGVTHIANPDFTATAPDTTGMFIRNDGLKLYLSGDSADEVVEYDLTTPWDLTTATENDDFLVGSENTGVTDVHLSPDGTKMYITGNLGTAEVVEYTLTTAWDVTTAGSAYELDVSANSSLPEGVFFRGDGARMYVLDAANNIDEYHFTIPWDLSTAIYIQTESVTLGSDIRGFYMSPDGVHVFTIDSSVISRHGLGFNITGTVDIRGDVEIGNSVSGVDATLRVGGNGGNSTLVVESNGAGNMITAVKGGVSEFVVTDTGEVGISAPTPTAYLDINANSSSLEGLSITQDGTADIVEIFDGSTEVFTILDGGNVGINDSTPGNTLTVGGSISSRDALVFGDGSTQLYARTGTDVGWSISTAVESQSLDVSGEDTIPTDVFFRPGGKQMYVVGVTDDEIVEYDLSTAWDITTASATQMTAVATNPQGVYFRPDGQQMFVIGLGSVSVQPYDLSTAWDSSTASATASFSVSGEETLPTGLTFKPDGTKMFIVGLTDDEIVAYDVSTPWDVTTASLSATTSVPGGEDLPTGLIFRPDGMKLYLMGQTADEVTEYDLEIPWDITTAAVVNTFSVTPSAPEDITFSYDGNKMYVVGSGIVYEHDLGLTILGRLGIGTDNPSVPLHASGTGGIKWEDGDHELQITTPGGKTGLIFNTNSRGDYARFNIRNYDSPTTSEQHFDLSYGYGEGLTLTNAARVGIATTTPTHTLTIDGSIRTTEALVFGDGSTAATARKGFVGDVRSARYVQEDNLTIVNPSGFGFDPTGTRLYVWSDAEDIIQYSLSTPWDISTLTQVNSFDTNLTTSPRPLYVRPDGKKIYVAAFGTRLIYEYDFGTAWDVTTLSLNNTYSASEIDASLGLTFKPDGTIMYVVDTNADTVVQYNMSTPWDISTAVANPTEFDVSPIDTVPRGIGFSSDGIGMYIVATAVEDEVDYYRLDTPWDPNTARHISSINVNAQDTGMGNIFVKPDGTRFYLSGGTGDELFEYHMGLTGTEGTLTIGGSLEISNGAVIFDDGSMLAAAPVNVYGGLSTVVDTGRSYVMSSEQNSVQGFFISPDGTRMYASEAEASDRVAQYTLTTPWDVTTATSAVTTSLSNSGDLEELTFSVDGRYVYIVENTGDDVDQYVTATPWDITTLQYVGTFDIALSVRGIDFRPDGKQMYLGQTVEEQVIAYDLSIPWDITTATQTSDTLDVPSGFDIVDNQFTGDGRTLYVLDSVTGPGDGRVYEYHLTSAWDITTAIKTSEHVFDYPSLDSSAIHVSPDGQHFYITDFHDETVWQIRMGITGPDNILNIGGNLKLASPGALEFYDGSTIGSGRDNTAFLGSVGSLSKVVEHTIAELASHQGPDGMYISPDGLHLYTMDANSEDVHQFLLATPWDIASESYVREFDADKGGNPDLHIVTFRPDGLKMYVGRSAIDEYDLSTAWDISTAVLNDTSSTLTTGMEGATFKPDGTKLFTVSGTDVYEHTLTTPWDVTTLSEESTYSVSGEVGFDAHDIQFNSAGTKMYILDDDGFDYVQEYDLTTPWDVSSRVHVREQSFTGNVAPRGLFVNAEATKLYVSAGGGGVEEIMEFDFGMTVGGNVGILNVAPGVALHVGSTSVSDSTDLLRLEDTNSTCNFDADSGTPSCGSDETLKKNILYVDEGNLELIAGLEPVTYNWLSDDNDAEPQFGFIAQDVELVIPSLVSTSTWINGEEKLFLNIGEMTPYLVGAVGELERGLTDEHAPIELEDGTPSFAARFLERLRGWFASATNGITDFFARRATVETLCVGTAEDRTCINKDQLDVILEDNDIESEPEPEVTPDPEPPAPEETSDTESSSEEESAETGTTTPEVSTEEEIDEEVSSEAEETAVDETKDVSVGETESEEITEPEPEEETDSVSESEEDPVEDSVIEEPIE